MSNPIFRGFRISRLKAPAFKIPQTKEQARHAAEVARLKDRIAEQDSDLAIFAEAMAAPPKPKPPSEAWASVKRTTSFLWEITPSMPLVLGSVPILLGLFVGEPDRVSAASNAFASIMIFLLLAVVFVLMSFATDDDTSEADATDAAIALFRLAITAGLLIIAAPYLLSI